MALTDIAVTTLATIMDRVGIPRALKLLRDEVETRLAALELASGVSSDAFHVPVADAAALAAIPVADRTDGAICTKLDDLTTWQFDAQSVAGASATVIVPAAGTGRWLRVTPLLDEVVAAQAAADAAQADATQALADAATAQGTADLALPFAAIQTARVAMVAGSATFNTLKLSAGSKVFAFKEIEDPAASGLLTVGAITPGDPGSVDVTSANGAETSTIRILVLG